MSQSQIKKTHQSTTTDTAKKASQCCVGAGSGKHDPSCSTTMTDTDTAKKVGECCVGYGASGSHDPSCNVGMKSGTGTGTGGVSVSSTKRALMVKDQRSIFNTILNDHARVNDLYQQFNATMNKEERNKIAALIIKEITVHSFLEESILYPLLDKKLNVEGVNYHEHSIQEHQRVKNLLYKIDQKFEPSTEEFIATLNEVMNNLHHHIDEEENKILPKLQSKLSIDEEIELGESWKNRLSMGAVPTHPHPSQPTTEPLATMAAMGAKPLDIARDAARFGSDTGKTIKESIGGGSGSGGVGTGAGVGAGVGQQSPTSTGTAAPKK